MMAAITNHPLIQVTEEQMENVRQQVGLSEEKIKLSLEAIEDWARKEEHLAKAFQYLDKNTLMIFLFTERGSVERTKQRIDRFLTTRGMVPEICLNQNIDDYDNILRNICVTNLPKLNPSDLTRIGFVQLRSEKANETDVQTFFKYTILLLDYFMRFDYNLGHRFIVDLKHVNLSGLSKLNPFVLKKVEVLCANGFGFRLKGIHFVNASQFTSMAVSLVKSVLNHKLGKRIYVHETFEDLQKEIPKDILPEDYGGNSLSCAALSEKSQSLLKTDEARKIIESINKLQSDNSKRSSYEFNAEYLGTTGSFRKLIID